MEGRTPNHMIREELKREKLRGRARSLAWGFEKKLERGEGSELARMCWEEIRKRVREERDESEWEAEKRKFFEERGFRVQKIDRIEKEEKDWFGKVIKEDNERWEKICRSGYNK